MNWLPVKDSRSAIPARSSHIECQKNSKLTADQVCSTLPKQMTISVRSVCFKRKRISVKKWPTNVDTKAPLFAPFACLSLILRSCLFWQLFNAICKKQKATQKKKKNSIRQLQLPLPFISHSDHLKFVYCKAKLYFFSPSNDLTDV